MVPGRSNSITATNANASTLCAIILTVIPSNEIYELWTVLEETENRDGYKIYFDEETKMFGLGMNSEKGEFIDIGNYGTFLKTLYSM